MPRTSIASCAAYLGAALFVLPSLACSGDDAGTETGVAMTFSMTAANDGTVTGADDGTMTGDDDGVATGMSMTTAADSGTQGGVDTGTMMGSSDDGTPAPPTCQHQCTVPQDCFIGGDETGLGCNMGTCSIACTGDMECIAASSGWTLVPCTGDGDCSGGRCVDSGGGVGGCSLQPSQGPCADAGLVDMMATAIGGGMVTVCGQPNAMCSPLGAQNVCIVGCAGNPCAGELSCGPTDGLCHCEFDTQCVDAGAGNNCNADGLCEFSCTMAADCPGHPFDGGMLVCQ